LDAFVWPVRWLVADALPGDAVPKKVVGHRLFGYPETRKCQELGVRGTGCFIEGVEEKLLLVGG
jgi:hypothetical protein